MSNISNKTPESAGKYPFSTAVSGAGGVLNGGYRSDVQTFLTRMPDGLNW